MQTLELALKKRFKITLGNISYKEQFEDYLKHVEKRGGGNLATVSQSNYIKELEQFTKNRIEPLGIGENFDIYRLDINDSNIIEILELLREVMKENRDNSFLSGDSSVSIGYYIDFIKSKMS